MRVLVTRPEAEARALAAQIAARGLQADLAPMLTLHPLKAAPDLSGISALLFTSANGVRAFAAATPRRDLPVYAVGEATARVARDLGFPDVQAAGGDVEKLAALVMQTRQPASGALYHAAGDTLAGDLKAMLEAAGFTVRRETLYRAEPAAALPADLAACFASGGYRAALFFSPRSAAVFVRLAEAAGIVPGAAETAALCLSANVAAALAPLPWRQLSVAAAPAEAAMLALLDEAARGEERR